MPPFRSVARACDAVADRLTRRRPPTEEVRVGDRSVTIRRLGGEPVADGAGGVPLVVALHGFGGTEAQLGTLVPLARCAGRIEYVGLRGEWSVVGGGYAWFPVVGDSPTMIRPDLVELDRAIDQLVATIDQLRGSGDRPVWLVGYSQGAPLALQTLESRPDLVSGIIVGAGGFLTEPPGEPVDLGGRHAFVAATSTDRLVAPEIYRETVDRLRRSGVTVTVETEAVPHVISDTQADAADAWLLDRLAGAKCRAAGI